MTACVMRRRSGKRGRTSSLLQSGRVSAVQYVLQLGPNLAQCPAWKAYLLFVEANVQSLQRLSKNNANIPIHKTYTVSRSTAVDPTRTNVGHPTAHPTDADSDARSSCLRIRRGHEIRPERRRRAKREQKAGLRPQVRHNQRRACPH